jgi:large subunit ribosomal protein L6
MSRIGKNPIIIPSGTTVTVEGQAITVKGPKGELKHTVNPEITVKVEENTILVTRQDDSKTAKSLHGLNRTLIANMVSGVNKEFERKLEIIGVGYRANLQGRKIVFSLGYSHPVEFEVPNGVTVTQEDDNKNILTVRSIDKHAVGQVSANIREFKKPEPYKGKGIRYVGEYVRRKAGKSAGK